MVIPLKPVTQGILWARFRFVYLIMTTTTLVQQSSSEVHRLYSPTSENGHSVACADNQVIMTCHATGSRLTWTATSNLRGRIVFVSTDPAWTVMNQDTITGILIQNDPSDNNLRMFVSELRVHATRSSQAINVTCSSDSGSSSHIISPPAHPEPPTFKDHVLLSQSNTTSQYYLQWETPANHGDIDLDHYELCIAENLVQKVHPEQRYAVIDVYSGFTAVVRLAAIDKCGQVSNYSQISITPTNHSDSGMENIVTSVTTATARDDQGTSSPILSLVLIPVICSCIIALVSMFLAILCTVILIRHKHHPVPDSDTDGRVNAKNKSLKFKAVEYEAEV